MAVYPQILEDVIDFYKKLPGIGEKNAERLALATRDIDEEELKEFAATIVNLEKLHACPICGHLTDMEKCNICSDESRNKSVICVTEDSKSVFTFEKSGHFNGVYHVLNGLISPIDDITPDDINIASLVKRINDLDDVELILSLKSSVEGETTMLYLKKIFEDSNVKISRLSYGIPIGTEIDYLDPLTIDKALNDRKTISE